MLEKENSKYLVAYYVSQEPIDEDLLRNHLAKHLPDYMIPSAFVSLKALPITVNGKLDRAALPEPDFQGDEYVAPRTALEKKLCEIWQTVLDLDQVGVKDDFYRLGGDSILSIQLIWRLRDNNLTCNVNDIFEQRTVEELAHYLMTERQETAAEQEELNQSFSTSQTLLDKLQGEGDIEAIHLANSLQQGFIYHALSQPKDDAYRLQVLWDYESPINSACYKEAWSLAIQTYPALRTYFNWEEELLQITLKTGQLQFIEHDIRGVKDKDQAIESIQVRDRAEGFDLGKPPLLRLHLIQQDSERYTLLQSLHHSIIDGWSEPRARSSKSRLTP